MLMSLLPEEREAPSGVPARAWIVIGATALAIAINAAAAMVGSQAEQDRAPTLVDPADYAFSIWGIIFLVNVAFAVYQALPAQRYDPLLDRVAVPYVAGQVFAATFAIATLVDVHALGQVSTVLYFVFAVATYFLLGVGARDDGWARRLCAWTPASMSAAWLLVATIVVLADFLQNDLEVSPPFGSGPGWAAGAVATAGAIAASLLAWRRDYVFGAVTVWALIAIGRQHENETVEAAVIAGIATIGLIALGMLSASMANLLRGRRREPQTGAR